jgi:hypothetical protein
MIAMMNYMRSHYCNDIIVQTKLTTNLKEYNEYDEDVRLYLELMNPYSMKIEEGMVSLNENFSTRNRSELKNILVDGLQKSLNRIFTPYFIRVVNDDHNTPVPVPQVQFVCGINSQEDKVGKYIIPHCWVYRESITNKVLGYLVGIGLHFDATFTIPESDITYAYSAQGKPENEIRNIQDVKEGYLHMSAMCFAEFANKMARNLGLQEIYFQE